LLREAALRDKLSQSLGPKLGHRNTFPNCQTREYLPPSACPRLPEARSAILCQLIRAPMLFSTPLFLFVFLPFAVLFYQTVPAAWRNMAIVLISVLFYAWGEPRFVFVVFVSSLVDYALASHIARGGPFTRVYLALGIAGNLGLLFVFKYADFTLHGLQPLLGSMPYLGLVLPLGISFFVFEKITYLVDIHRRTSPPAASLLDYLVFVFLFPKMLAGPIIKYREIAPSLLQRPKTLDDFVFGFRRFLWGLAKKVLVADVCGEVADAVFGLPSTAVGFATAWAGVLAFTVQIYFDFSGYSDMAIGLARMFGFRLRENFDHPYGAASFTEFWRRWHISLSTWIRDYLYFPLGGNRGSDLRTYGNLWICFLLSGLWHGANWTFVSWGAYNGCFLIADRLFWLRIASRLPRPITVGINLLCVMVGWALFRAADFGQARAMISAMASPALVGEFVWVQPYQMMAIAVGLGGSLLAATDFGRRAIVRLEAASIGRLGTALGAAALGGFALSKAVTVTFNPFLYFRF
jgi:alginate O-acetyltransferase complex protein AlgI